MTSTLLSRAPIALDRLFTPICILFFVALAYNHYQLITYDIPLDRNEAGMLSITATVAAGDNPYALESQPARASVYPILYNVIVAPLSLVFGNTLELHRIVSGIFILASCLLIYLITLRPSQSPRNSFAAASLFYAGLLYYSTPIASPNSIGILLFLLSVFIPWLYGYSNRSLIAALLLGVMAFYGKQYFLASLGYLALYLFIAISKGKGIIFGAVSLVVFLCSVFIAIQTSPYFLDNTVFSVKYATQFIASDETLLNQLLEFCTINLPILIIVALQLATTVRAGNSIHDQISSGDGSKRIINLRDFGAPLLTWKPDYIWYCFFCSVLIIVFVVGKNRGNHLTYLFQFLSPFLLAGTFIGVSRAIKLRWLYQLLAIAAFYSSYSMLSHDFSIQKKNWEKLQQVISTGDDIYASTMVLGEILKRGGEVYQNGHTPYTRFAVWQPKFMQKKNPEETAAHIWENYVKNIHGKIVAQEFDLIILDERTKIPNPQSYSSANLDGKTLLKKHYRRREVIPISLANRLGGGKYQIEIWEPITKSPQENTTAP